MSTSSTARIFLLVSNLLTVIVFSACGGAGDRAKSNPVITIDTDAGHPSNEDVYSPGDASAPTPDSSDTVSPPDTSVADPADADGDEDVSQPPTPGGPNEPGNVYVGAIELSEEISFNVVGNYFDVVTDGPGVLDVAIRGVESQDIQSFEVHHCTDDDQSCVRLRSRVSHVDEDWVPRRYQLAIEEAGEYRLLFKGRAQAEMMSIDVSIHLMTWQESDESHQAIQTARPITHRTLHRGIMTGRATRWYRFEAPSAGYFRLSSYASSQWIFVCDHEQWGGVPSACTGSLVASQPVQSPLYIDEPGTYYVLAMTQRRDNPYQLAFYFEPDPNYVPCSPEERHDGAGGCAPAGECAAGLHDGGWGRCIPEETCEYGFRLRSDLRCEGWLGVDYYLGQHLQDVISLADGRILAAPSFSESGNNDFQPAIYAPSTNVFTPTSALDAAYPQAGQRFCPLSDGRVLVVEYSGFVVSIPERTDRIYDPATDQWTELSTQPYAWARPECLMTSTGSTLVFETNRAALFDPLTEQWTSTPSFANTQDTTSIMAPDGTIFSAGYPTDATSNPSQAHRGLRIRNATTGQWTATSRWPMESAAPSVRSGLLFHQGDVLVFSGRWSNNTSVQETFAYSPATDTWAERGLMPRHISVASVVPDGNRALVVWTNGATAFYTPADDSWQELPNLPAGGGGKAFRLGTNDFLVAGLHPVRFHVTP
ncbi:MAG: hypothetical protein ACNA8W_17855 [Bradymonadaceae bacterium]